MARTVFVDTACLIALLDPRDALNGPALELAETLGSERARLVSSDAILIELANFFCRTALRSEAIEWIGTLRAAGGWEITGIDRPLLARAEALYGRHRDKHWSLTDCLSMELMRSRRIRDAATSDRGFEQAGFRALLLPS